MKRTIDGLYRDDDILPGLLAQRYKLDDEIEERKKAAVITDATRKTTALECVENILTQTPLTNRQYVVWTDTNNIQRWPIQVNAAMVSVDVVLCYKESEHSCFDTDFELDTWKIIPKECRVRMPLTTTQHAEIEARLEEAIQNQSLWDEHFVISRQYEESEAVTHTEVIPFQISIPFWCDGEQEWDTLIANIDAETSKYLPESDVIVWSSAERPSIREWPLVAALYYKATAGQKMYIRKAIEHPPVPFSRPPVSCISPYLEYD